MKTLNKIIRKIPRDLRVFGLTVSFLGLASFGAHQLGGSSRYTGKNYVYAHVENIENTLEKEICFQYKDIKSKYISLQKNYLKVDNLISEKDSLKKTETYLEQKKNVQKNRLFRQIPYSILILGGFLGGIGSIMALGDPKFLCDDKDNPEKVNFYSENYKE